MFCLNSQPKWQKGINKVRCFIQLQNSDEWCLYCPLDTFRRTVPAPACKQNPRTVRNNVRIEMSIKWREAREKKWTQFPVSKPLRYSFMVVLMIFGYTEFTFYLSVTRLVASSAAREAVASLDAMRYTWNRSRFRVPSSKQIFIVHFSRYIHAVFSEPMFMTK